MTNPALLKVRVLYEEDGFYRHKPIHFTGTNLYILQAQTYTFYRHKPIHFTGTNPYILQAQTYTSFVQTKSFCLFRNFIMSRLNELTRRKLFAWSCTETTFRWLNATLS